MAAEKKHAGFIGSLSVSLKIAASTLSSYVSISCLFTVPLWITLDLFTADYNSYGFLGGNYKLD